MNRTEFDRWWADLLLRWPSVSVWLAKSFPDATQQAALLRTWRDVLKDVAIADCLEVNQKMQSGDLGWVGEYDADKERLPQHVRRLARQLTFERDGYREEAEPSRPRQPTDFPAGKILRKILALVETGTPRDEARALVLANLPVGRPAWEPRYSCLTCHDSGRVLVASATAIEAMLLGTFDRCHHREGVMRCTCDKGQRLVRRQHGHDLRWETFSEENDFAVVDPLWRDAEVLRFEEWVNIQAKKHRQPAEQSAINF